MNYERCVSSLEDKLSYESCLKVSLEAIEEDLIAEKLRECLYYSNDDLIDSVNHLNEWFNERINL